MKYSGLSSSQNKTIHFFPEVIPAPPPTSMSLSQNVITVGNAVSKISVWLLDMIRAILPKQKRSLVDKKANRFRDNQGYGSEIGSRRGNQNFEDQCQLMKHGMHGYHFKDTSEESSAVVAHPTIHGGYTLYRCIKGENPTIQRRENVFVPTF